MVHRRLIVKMVPIRVHITRSMTGQTPTEPQVVHSRRTRRSPCADRIMASSLNDSCLFVDSGVRVIMSHVFAARPQ